MNVTEQQMNQLVSNAMPCINGAVNRFVNRCYHLRQDKQEDFVSVCVLALIEHIHAAQDEVEAMRFHPLMYVKAMASYELSTLPVTVPHATARYRQYIRQSHEAIQRIGRQADAIQDKTLMLVEVRSFADSLTDEQQKVLSLLLCGCTLQEIANQMGRSIGWVFNTRNAIRVAWQNEL